MYFALVKNEIESKYISCLSPDWVYRWFFFLLFDYHFLFFYYKIKKCNQVKK